MNEPAGALGVASRRLLIGLLSAALTTLPCQAGQPSSAAIQPSKTAPGDLALALDQLAIGPVARAHNAIYEITVLWSSTPDQAGPSYPADVEAAVREAMRMMAGSQRTLPSPHSFRSPETAKVALAISGAARVTNVSTAYLWRTAMRESGLDPTAQSPSSTARGLFQFVEQTWLVAIGRYGRRHGLSIAPKVDAEATGALMVHGPYRHRILQLRDDPWIAATMAGELANENRHALERALGRRVSDEELYVAHLLGASDAGTLITAAARAPATPANLLLPKAAAANSAVFYSKGRPLSAGRLMRRLRHG